MKRKVIVTIEVDVTVNEAKFTTEWMTEWRESFYNFRAVEDHIQHIGQLAAREMLNPSFTEGYGPLADMGIEARVVGHETEIVKKVT